MQIARLFVLQINNGLCDLLYRTHNRIHIAVIASAATGLISGSSIANVVTTGTFTIPLMKKVGFSPTRAGAVEVSSSINGVLTPPVMGAVAFLMTEYVGISYLEVVKTAIMQASNSAKTREKCL